jgi:GT2 family glycosyltransferase
MTSPSALLLEAALVIPSYNRADLIAETLTSALAQTLPFREIVVVDDGSTDHTRSVLSRFGDQIRCIFSPNQGVQAARNLGIANSTSALVVFLDSDDLLEPDYLATVLPWMSEHAEIDALYTNFRTFSAHRTDPDKLSCAPFDFTAGASTSGDFCKSIPDLYPRSLQFQPLFTCGLMVRREFMSKHGGYDTRFKGVGSEDWEFTLRMISCGEIALCTRPLARVRKHGSNDSSSNLHMSLGEVQVLRHSLAHHLKAREHVKSVEQSIERRLLNALNTAFDERLFDQVIAIGRTPGLTLPKKEIIKLMVANLPSSWRYRLWTWAQWASGTKPR